MTDGDVLSPQQAAELNEQLAKMPSSELSIEQGRHAADYIAIALNMNSVDENLRSNLEVLLEALQGRNK